MRKLMWFTIGFTASCGLCAYILPDSWIFPSLFVVVILMAASVIVGKDHKVVRKGALVFFGCAAGFAWFLIFQRFYLLPAASLDGTEASITITAADYGYDTAYGTAFDGTLTVEDKPYQIRAYINEKKNIQPGDEITGTFRFRLTTPDGLEEATYHSGKGIFLLGYQSDAVEIAAAVKSELRYYPAILADQIKAVLQAYFPEDVFPFAKALLLGDSTDLGYETDTDFKISGIRHVVAVSGLHVSILFALLSTITFRKRLLTALLGFPALFLFAAVAGFTPSVTRACIMSALMLIALLLDKEYDGATALAFAALVMLLANPLGITSVSFQLSVGSVAGIYLFNSGIHGWLLKLFRKPKAFYAKWISTSVSISLSAMTITTPLCAYYFGTVSLIGVVTNLLALWVISFIFYGIMAVCIASLIWSNGALLLAKVVAIPIRYVLWISDVLAGLPLAAVYTASVYVIAWLVFCYCLLLIFLFSKQRRPDILGCCAAIGLCLALLASWAEPLMDECRVTVLDVGQGQSILLQSQGRTYLVDCGGDSDTETADIVAETLLSQGVDRLDGIILTHFDRDHAGAAANLLTRIQTDILLMPYTVDAATAAEITTNLDGKIIYLDQDLQLTYGNTEMTVFAPIYSGNDNENSLCVLFETENCDILITGDRSGFGERMLLRKAELPHVDLLIAGHHGSKNSTSTELLQAVQPETVIISAGEDNPYGHPAPELLERLAEFGCAVCRTDESGTIIYRR